MINLLVSVAGSIELIAGREAKALSSPLIPDLLIGFAADLEHLLALELQLFGQSADVLVERVDLVVQLSDVVLPPGDLLLQLGDPPQQLTLLGSKTTSAGIIVEVPPCYLHTNHF